jgi:hypothetical protein
MVPSIEDDNEDSETNQPPKAVPKKASRVLELADGSEDSDDNDNARHAPDSIVDDTENESGDSDGDQNKNEAPAESAEAELSQCPISLSKTLS